MSHGVTIAPPRYAPQIPIDPPSERVGREQINLLLQLACLQVFRFSTAVSLIRHCKPLIGPELGIEPAGWMGIAVRDAVFSVYHFGKIRGAFSVNLRNCPSLQARVDLGKFRYARKAFAHDFPDTALLRNAVGHLGEQLSTPEKTAELQRPGEFLVWEEQVGGYFSMASRKGRQVRLNVDEQSLAKLQTILAAICEAFADADPTWHHACG